MTPWQNHDSHGLLWQTITDRNRTKKTTNRLWGYLKAVIEPHHVAARYSKP
jgi:hypothetical protein